MTGVVTALEPGIGVTPCDTISFTLTVSADGQAAIGKDGSIDQASAEIANGRYTIGGLTLPCATQTTVSGLTLNGVDSNGDGNADSLTGTVDAMAYSGGGGVVSVESLSIAISGAPDVTGPKLEPPTDPVNPILSWSIAASEPLAPTAALTLAGTPSLALVPGPTAFITWTSNELPNARQRGRYWRSDVGARFTRANLQPHPERRRQRRALVPLAVPV
jgi:hypothetical protein